MGLGVWPVLQNVQKGVGDKRESSIDRTERWRQGSQSFGDAVATGAAVDVEVLGLPLVLCSAVLMAFLCSFSRGGGSTILLTVVASNESAFAKLP